MNDVLVSICCITYNHEKFIAQAIQGFLMQQTQFTFEIIIHDDASTDNTQNIIREYAKEDSRVIPILRETNIKSTGVAVFPITFKMAKGKYIAMCEGDDYWTDPLKLQKQVDYLEENRDYVLSFHNVRIVDEANNILNDHVLKYPTDQLFLPEEISLTYMPTLSLVFRNNLINWLSFPDVFNGDAFLLGLLSQFGKAYYHNAIWADYRKHGGGIYSGNKAINNHIQSIKTRKELIKRLPGNLRLSVRKSANTFYILLLKELFKNDKVLVFLKYDLLFLINCIFGRTIKSFIGFHYNVFIKKQGI